jgi:hypothetical protein
MTIERMVAELREIRAWMLHAIAANVDLPDFDPAQHGCVKAIDAVIKALREKL